MGVSVVLCFYDHSGCLETICLLNYVSKHMKSVLGLYSMETQSHPWAAVMGAIHVFSVHLKSFHTGDFFF